MDTTTLSRTHPPTESQLEAELRDKTERLEELTQVKDNLQTLLTLGRQESDFDLFYRRLTMAKIFSRIPPNTLSQLNFNEFYFEYWQVAGDAHRTTKFAEQEKDIAKQLLEQAHGEQDPVRRQYLALALIVFDELQEAQKFIDQSLWPPQLKADFATFMKWHDLAYNPISLQSRAKLAQNEYILAFLQQKYSTLIRKYEHATLDDCPRISQDDYQIYFCWLQGEAHLPPIVRCCYNALKQNAGHYKIVFIDEKNLSQYVDIAPHIMDKFRAGKISRTHFSDVLRFNLLERHGGLWMDATILVTEPLENHRDFWTMNYFSPKGGKDPSLPDDDAKYVPYSNWTGSFQGTSVKHNPIYVFGKEFFEEYWSEFNEVIDYFLTDFMVELAYENIPIVQEEINAVPINHVEIETLYEHLNDSYAEYPFDKILQDHFLHKLNWKNHKFTLDMTRPDTVFREIQRRYAPETIQKQKG